MHIYIHTRRHIHRDRHRYGRTRARARAHTHTHTERERERERERESGVNISPLCTPYGIVFPNGTGWYLRGASVLASVIAVMLSSTAPGIVLNNSVW